jgi:hypothetical protein
MLLFHLLVSHNRYQDLSPVPEPELPADDVGFSDHLEHMRVEGIACHFINSTQTERRDLDREWTIKVNS